jgi:hypothetical protein
MQHHRDSIVMAIFKRYIEKTVKLAGTDEDITINSFMNKWLHIARELRILSKEQAIAVWLMGKAELCKSKKELGEMASMSSKTVDKYIEIYKCIRLGNISQKESWEKWKKYYAEITGQTGSNDKK